MSGLTFAPGDNCFLMTKAGAMMPAIYVADGERDGICEVASRSGQVYTAQLANVYDPISGRIIMLQQRGERLLDQGYLVRIRKDGTFRVWQPDRHGSGPEAGYILRPDPDAAARGQRILLCSCPSFHEALGCKHTAGLIALLWGLQKRYNDLRKFDYAARIGEIAEAITFR